MLSLAVAMLAGATLASPEPWPATGVSSVRLLPDGNASADASRCYALMPRAGERIRIILEGSSFRPKVRIARGALCPPDTSLVEAAASGPAHTATLDFVAAGGRYLLFVTGPAQGLLSARIEQSLSATAAASPDETAPAATVAAVAAAPSSRRALMERQVAAYEQAQARAAEEARIAAEQRRIEEERARIRQAAREAEQRARDAEIAQNNARANAYLAQTLAGVARQVGTALGQSVAADAANERRIAELNIRQRELARQAQQAAVDRAAAQRAPPAVSRGGTSMPAPTTPSLTPQQIEARRAADVLARRQAAAQSGSVITTSQSPDAGQSRPAAAPKPAAAEVIAMLEGVVVCPLNPDRAKLFGESICHGPFQNSMADHRKASDVRYACGSDSAPRDLGMYGNNHVWGCNFGINPRRSGSPNIDQAARFGLIVPPRRTFRCDAKIDGYCRS